MSLPSPLDPDTLGTRVLGVIETRGWRAWTLRDVAEALAVSPAILTRAGGDKATLARRAAEAAADELRLALHEANAQVDFDDPGYDPDDDVVRVAFAWVGFAVARPEAWAVLTQAAADDVGLTPARARLWIELNTVVRMAVPNAADATALALWSLLVGRMSLARGELKQQPADAGLADAVRILLVGARTQAPLDSPLSPPERQDP